MSTPYRTLAECPEVDDPVARWVERVVTLRSAMLDALSCDNEGWRAKLAEALKDDEVSP